MSPALLKKYLEAAREVAEPPGPEAGRHSPSRRTRCSSTPTATSTASAASSTSTSGRTPTTPTTSSPPGGTSTAPRSAGPTRRLPTSPPKRKVSAKYLATRLDASRRHGRRRSARSPKLQAMWRELPAPDDERARRRASRLRADARLRRRSCARSSSREFKNLVAAGRQRGRSQPFVLWKNRQYATHRMTFDRGAAAGRRRARGPRCRSPTTKPARQRVRPRPHADRQQRAGDPDLVVPAGQRAEYEAAFAPLLRVFPDTFYMPSAAGTTSTQTKDRGRYLERRLPQHDRLLPRRPAAVRADPRRRRSRRSSTAVAGVRLHRSANARTYIAVHLVRDRARPAAATASSIPRARGQDVTSERRSRRLETVYLARRPTAAMPTALEAIARPFRHHQRSHPLRREGRVEAEPRHLEALLTSPTGVSPAADERGAPRSAARSTARCATRTASTTRTPCANCVVSVLMSPHFCYRVDLRARRAQSVQPAVRLRAGQPAELLPLVEHAGRGTAGRARPVTCTSPTCSRPRRGGC